MFLFPRWDMLIPWRVWFWDVDFDVSVVNLVLILSDLETCASWLGRFEFHHDMGPTTCWWVTSCDHALLRVHHLSPPINLGVPAHDCTGWTGSEGMKTCKYYSVLPVVLTCFNHSPEAWRCITTWVFPNIMVPPKSSIWIGFSIIFTIHFGVPLFSETPTCS